MTVLSVCINRETRSIRIGRAEGVDFLLPIGGGSVIDTAKGIGYGIANDFEMEDLLYGRVKTDKNLPIGVILTIAAAGSEMSSSMVLTIEDGMMKRSYGHDCARPKFAIMNPELTYSLPAYQTARIHLKIYHLDFYNLQN